MTLHGKTKIELFKSGKPVLVHEESNMVTNLVSDMLSAHCGPQYLMGNCSMDPLYLYRGLLLFKNTIDEDVDNYSFPDAENSLTGRGYESTSLSADLDTGTYNSNLSYVNDAHIHFVWDFDEEHANGPISCVCLTPQVLAQIFRRDVDYVSTLAGIGLPAAASGAGCEPVFQALSATTLPIFFDTETNSVYCMSQISSEGQIAITKYSMNKLRPITGSQGMWSYTPSAATHYAMDLFHNFYAQTVATVDISQIVTVDGTYSGATVDRDGFLYVFATNSSTIPTNGQLSMAKINVRTGAVTTYTLTNYSSSAIQLYRSPMSGNKYRSLTHRSMFAFAGYFCMRTTDGKFIAVNIETNSEYHNTNYTFSAGFEDTTSNNFPSTTIDGISNNNQITANCTTVIPLGPKTLGILYYNGGPGKLSINAISMEDFSTHFYTPTSLILGTRGNGSNILGNFVVTDKGPYLGHMIPKYENASYASFWNGTELGSYFWVPMSCGLQTINNLDAQVVKTADLTMRVTYDLEEEAPVGTTTPELENQNNGGE